MTALRVKAHATTASFRYPRVQVGKLPTFEMPPPATIYGHLASVVGEWFDPVGLMFAYVFRFEGKGIDVETSHPLESGSGRTGLSNRGWKYPVNVECAPNPQRREFLYRPKLTLYLKGNQWLLERFALAFPNPHYSYVLGRSQDLATCTEARFVELETRQEALFANTLLPYEWRPFVFPGVSVVMPEAIDYTNRRNVLHERYLQITSPPLRLFAGTPDATDRKMLPNELLTDPEETFDVSGRVIQRGLHFLLLRNAATTPL